jgi:hypothetical protein
VRIGACARAVGGRRAVCVGGGQPPPAGANPPPVGARVRRRQGPTNRSQLPACSGGGAQRPSNWHVERWGRRGRGRRVKKAPESPMVGACAARCGSCRVFGILGVGERCAIQRARLWRLMCVCVCVSLCVCVCMCAWVPQTRGARGRGGGHGSVGSRVHTAGVTDGHESMMLGCAPARSRVRPMRLLAGAGGGPGRNATQQ